MQLPAATSRAAGSVISRDEATAGPAMNAQRSCARLAPRCVDGPGCSVLLGRFPAGNNRIEQGAHAVRRQSDLLTGQYAASSPISAITHATINVRG
jgi:hypothetical protein